MNEPKTKHNKTIAVSVPVTVTVYVPIDVPYSGPQGEVIGQQAGIPVVNAEDNEELIKATLETAHMDDRVIDVLTALKSAVDLYRRTEPTCKAQATPYLGIIPEFEI